MNGKSYTSPSNLGICVQINLSFHLEIIVLPPIMLFPAGVLKLLSINGLRSELEIPIKARFKGYASFQLPVHVQTSLKFESIFGL